MAGSPFRPPPEVSVRTTSRRPAQQAVCRTLRGLCAALLAAATVPASDARSQDLDSLLYRAGRFAQHQLAASVGAVGDSARFPRSTGPDGIWKTTRPREWTSGFFPGCLWLTYEATGDLSWKDAARRWTAGLDSMQYYGGTHDIGFIIFSSYGQGYRLDPSAAYRDVILQAARTLTTRFNPAVGCIKSWDNRKWQYPVIIDNMMNLELLFWASRNGGTRRMEEIAVSHAERTMTNHFRPDGSTYHVVGYDSATGTVVWKGTHQGLSDSSCWSRGQAWAIYGFTMSYRFTRDERFLRTAVRAADYFLAHLPPDDVPSWDFQAPPISDEPRDASAAAIAASGLLELSSFVPDAAARGRYAGAAERMLRALSGPAYLAEGTTSAGILLHAVGNKPSGGEVDVSLIYADYYYLEATARFRSLRAAAFDLGAVERVRVLAAARKLLKEKPRTITSFPSTRSAGGLHDFHSEGDYWWPDSANPAGPYVRRDGMTNPDNFTKHRDALFGFARAVAYLTGAYRLTGDERYAAHAVRQLRAWFSDPATRMNPHLLYAQAIKGRATGRGVGIIDTIHLIDVALAVEALEKSASLDAATKRAVREWFREYLTWLTTHEYGREERDAKNNHGTWWTAQVAGFAHLLGDSTQLAWCRERFTAVLLPDQMAVDGSFPLELARTKPYGYSIFNLEGFAALCQILSTPGADLWRFSLPDGRSMRRGMEFLAPYVADKSAWPYAKDVMHFEDLPVRHSALLFAGLALHEPRYIGIWKRLDPDPADAEMQRNLPIKSPLLWVRAQDGRWSGSR